MKHHLFSVLYHDYNNQKIINEKKKEYRIGFDF